MSDLVLNLAFALLAVSVLLGVVRLARGPTIVDRIVAFDAVVVCAVGLTVLLSDYWDTPHFLELILIISSLGFFSTVAFAAYLQRTEARKRAAGTDTPAAAEDDH
jgi:multisubunit Na+/H+ antiporter MnhF subunit